MVSRGRMAGWDTRKGADVQEPLARHRLDYWPIRNMASHARDFPWRFVQRLRKRGACLSAALFVEESHACFSVLDASAAHILKDIPRPSNSASRDD